MDRHLSLHTGWNTVRVTHYEVAPISDSNFTFFRIRLVNLYYKEYILMFKVPKDKDPHELLKHLHQLGRGIKPWFRANMESKTVQGQQILQIIGIKDVNESQEELEQESLDLRNPRLDKTSHSERKM